MNEGKMKAIAMLADESSNEHEFVQKLKVHLRSEGKAKLSNDKEFIDAMVKDWKDSQKSKETEEE